MTSKGKAGKQASPRRAASRIAACLRGLAVPIEELKLDPANVRAHDERNIQAIAASLQRFGQQKPVVIDPQGMVIAGNGTVLAARALGWRHVAAARSDLQGAETKAFAIADNRTAELAAWDDQALARQLAALRDDATIDHLVTGFTDKDIQELIGGIADSAEPAGREGPEIPECFQVVVECDSEEHQRRLYERLSAEGLKCRLLML